MKDAVKILAIIAGAVGAAALLTRKRQDGTSMYDTLAEKGRNWGEKISEYGSELKDKLMPEMKGPNGENVFSDMYDRQYYIDEFNERIYTDA